MLKYRIPSICIPCIDRNQAQCQHIHYSYSGGFHYSNGDVWDDIYLLCDDCGMNLDRLPQESSTDPEDEETPF